MKNKENSEILARARPDKCITFWADRKAKRNINLRFNLVPWQVCLCVSKVDSTPFFITSQRMEFQHLFRTKICPISEAISREKEIFVEKNIQQKNLFIHKIISLHSKKAEKWRRKLHHQNFDGFDRHRTFALQWSVTIFPVPVLLAGSVLVSLKIAQSPSFPISAKDYWKLQQRNEHIMGKVTIRKQATSVANISIYSLEGFFATFLKGLLFFPLSTGWYPKLHLLFV